MPSPYLNTPTPQNHMLLVYHPGGRHYGRGAHGPPAGPKPTLEVDPSSGRTEQPDWTAQPRAEQPDTYNRAESPNGTAATTLPSVYELGLPCEPCTLPGAPMGGASHGQVGQPWKSNLTSQGAQGAQAMSARYAKPLLGYPRTSRPMYSGSIMPSGGHR